LPVFDELKSVGCNTFETNSQPLYGIYEASGTEVLPPIYQKITILSENVIQGIFEGEIQYFDRSGKQLKF